MSPHLSALWAAFAQARRWACIPNRYRKPLLYACLFIGLGVAGVQVAPWVTNQYHHHRAQALQEQGDWGGALAHYTQVLDYYTRREEQARRVETLEAMVYCHREQGTLAEALPFYDEIIAHLLADGQGARATAYQEEAGAYYQDQGEFGRALAYLRPAVVFHQKAGQGYQAALGLARIAACHQARQEPDQARAAYVEALREGGIRSDASWAFGLAALYGREDPKAQAASLVLGAHLLMKQSFAARADALPPLETALDLHPLEATYELLGRLYISLDSTEAAARTLRRMHRSYPNNLYGHYARGILAWTQGDFTEAESRLERAATDAAYQPAYQTLTEFRRLDEQLRAQRAEIASMEHRQESMMTEAVLALIVPDIWDILFLGLSKLNKLRKLAKAGIAAKKLLEVIEATRQQAALNERLAAAKQEEARLELHRRALPDVSHSWQYFTDLVATSRGYLASMDRDTLVVPTGLPPH